MEQRRPKFIEAKPIKTDNQSDIKTTKLNKLTKTNLQKPINKSNIKTTIKTKTTNKLENKLENKLTKIKDKKIKKIPNISLSNTIKPNKNTEPFNIEPKQTILMEDLNKEKELKNESFFNDQSNNQINDQINDQIDNVKTDRFNVENDQIEKENKNQVGNEVENGDKKKGQSLSNAISEALNKIKNSSKIDQSNIGVKRKFDEKVISFSTQNRPQINKFKRVPISSTANVRCQFWPKCQKGANCPYLHPNKICTFYPNCARGNQCMFLHIDNSSMSNPRSQNTLNLKNIQNTQNIQNNSSFRSTFAPPQNCYYGVKCKNPSCRFGHPRPTAVKTKVLGSKNPKMLCWYGKNCRNKNCSFQHQSDHVESSVGLVEGGSKNEEEDNDKEKKGSNFSPLRTVKMDQNDSNDELIKVGEKILCKFDKKCQKIDCKFWHPLRERELRFMLKKNK